MYPGSKRQLWFVDIAGWWRAAAAAAYAPAAVIRLLGGRWAEPPLGVVQEDPEVDPAGNTPVVAALLVQAGLVRLEAVLPYCGPLKEAAAASQALAAANIAEHVSGLISVNQTFGPPPMLVRASLHHLGWGHPLPFAAASTSPCCSPPASDAPADAALLCPDLGFVSPRL